MYVLNFVFFKSYRRISAKKGVQTKGGIRGRFTETDKYIRCQGKIISALGRYLIDQLEKYKLTRPQMRKTKMEVTWRKRKSRGSLLLDPAVCSRITENRRIVEPALQSKGARGASC